MPHKRCAKTPRAVVITLNSRTECGFFVLTRPLKRICLIQIIMYNYKHIISWYRQINHEAVPHW